MLLKAAYRQRRDAGVPSGFVDGCCSGEKTHESHVLIVRLSCLSISGAESEDRGVIRRPDLLVQLAEGSEGARCGSAIGDAESVRALCRCFAQAACRLIGQT